VLKGSKNKNYTFQSIKGFTGLVLQWRELFIKADKILTLEIGFPFPQP